MKKLLVLMAAVAMTATMATAQNTTRIGSEHKVNFGANLGYGFSDSGKNLKSGNYGAALLDLNAEKCNYRTRFSLGWLQRNVFSPFASADAQYLFPIAQSGLYVYPSAGIRAEYFKNALNLGPQVAAGLEYQFNHSFGVFAEAGYQYNFLNDGVSRAVVNYGVKFALGTTKSAVAAAAAAAAEADAAARAAAVAKAAADKAAADKAAEEAIARAKAKNQPKAEAPKAEAPKAEAPKAAPVTYETAKVTVENIYFLLNDATVREEEAPKVLHIAEILKAFPSLKISIVGHADKSTGNADVNSRIAQSRVNAVAAMLNNLGVNPAQIVVSSVGDTANQFATPEENRVVVVSVVE